MDQKTSYVGKDMRVAKKPASNKDYTDLGIKIVVGVFALGLLFGVARAGLLLVDWGAGHQIVGQSIVAQALKLQLPFRVEKIERKVEYVVSPVAEKIANEELLPIEQKIIDRFGLKDGVIALAIFDCGESGLDQYAVSSTGDLGIAQINWRTWKKAISEKFGYNAKDMFDVDKNLEVAEWIFNRDGVRDSGDESWSPWSGFLNGSYARCFSK